MEISTKGWFRLWLAIAVVWWVGWLILLVTEEYMDCGTWLSCIVVTVLPPIILYIIGRVVYWIYKGFMGDKE